MRILLIEDNAGDARLLREMLNEHPSHYAQLTHVTTMLDAEHHLALHGSDLILLDLGLPDSQGVAAVRCARKAAPAVPLVVLTSYDDLALAAMALQEGAQDYLIKGEIETRGLIRALRYAVERKAMEDDLFAQKERAQVTLNCIGDAVACTDKEGNITFLNVAAEQMTGWSLEDALGQSMAEMFVILDATTRQPILSLSAVTAEQPQPVVLPPNGILIRRDGAEVPIEDSVSPIYDRDGRAEGAVVVFRDVTAARAISRQILHSAKHDFLTGLPNRMLLQDRIEQAIALAARHSRRVAVLFLDLDGFKHINDSLGHSIGDKLLQSVSRRLVGSVRISDTVSRQGGDEFVVLLSEVEVPDNTDVTARRMLQAVAEPHSIDQRLLHVTASIGTSIYPDDGLDAETLIKNADTAMYQAKENGRHSYRFFKPEMNVRAVQRQAIEENLRSALQRNELSIAYQPKVNLRTGQITGAEALLRWTEPVRGAVPPAEFIPVAEDSGLIIPIGNWVLREACAQAKSWMDAGLCLANIAVNISGIQFCDEHFLESILAILEETGLDPHYLELELTESILVKHAESAKFVLKALRMRGIQVSIDDFGTGYSSLSYLRRLPVDALKIDQSFIRQISHSEEETTIISAVIGMAHGLKLRVVAEGVETEEQMAFLQLNHCEEAQGYYFSRPIPPEQFANLLQMGLPKTPLPSLPPK